MTIKVSEEAGGPYSHEIDAIRDERYRARVMNTEPDFDALFADVEISPGAYKVIEDINKPVELPVGEFVENVVFHDEEEKAPESVVEEAAAEGNPNWSEGTAPEETGTVEGNGETGVESTSVESHVEEEVADLLDSPIFDEVSANVTA